MYGRGRGDSQLKQLVNDLDVRLLVASLISGNGCADPSQLPVAELCCVRSCVAVAHLQSALNAITH